MLASVKTSERAEARRLRADEGKSVREIAATVGVARSSVSRWVQDIELTEAQHASLLARNPIHNGQHEGARVRSELARARRRSWQEEGREAARQGDALHAAGCMLFWAEGGKIRTQVELSNSDPFLVRFFLRFLRACYSVDDARVSITCNLFADHLERQREVEEHWLAVLELPASSLRKSIVNNYSRRSARKRVNVLPWGTCRLRVHSTELAQQLFGAIQEYGGFTNEDWLDCLPGAAPRARS